MKRDLSKLVLLMALLMPGVVCAELQLASLFTDHMVLQRDMPVPVWGWADPGARIWVNFADQQKGVTADNNGRWRVTLNSLPASFEPRTLSVSAVLNAETEKLKCDDVVVGEVWICSGQSNMQMGVGGVPEVKALIPKSKHIRTFQVKRTVAFAEQDHCAGEWIERYPESAVAFGFAYDLQEAANAPVGIILTAWGSSSLEAWMPSAMADEVPHLKTLLDEFAANTNAQNQIRAALDGEQPWSKGDDIFMRRQTTILYNAMMHPLIPYACRGLVWYQGERNTQSMFGMVDSPWFARNSGIMNYGKVLKQWMQEYRKRWARDDFEFLVVMLPGYGSVLKTSPDVAKDHPIAHSWAWFRDSQLQALELPHTAVANTVDLGHVTNIHPKDKYPIGQRLALLAARDTLGQGVQAQGPMMNRVTVNGGSLIVHFDHAEGLQTTDDAAPSGFWIAGDSHEWVKASATIEGASVRLHSPELDKPLYVRYAFTGKPEVNLVNGVGLPAYPFRSDNLNP